MFILKPLRAKSAASSNEHTRSSWKKLLFASVSMSEESHQVLEKPISYEMTGQSMNFGCIELNISVDDLRTFIYSNLFPLIIYENQRTPTYE